MLREKNATETSAPPLTDQELVEKYGQLCGHIAWDFVRKNPDQLKREDAEEFASAALLRLIKCPAPKRRSKPYINVLIKNEIIRHWHRRLRQLKREADDKIVLPAHANNDHDSGNERLMDRFPDPRPLHAELMHSAFDQAKVLQLLPELCESERVVIELSFGLNGAKSFSQERIAKKLGRTRYWVESRLQVGIKNLRILSGVEAVF